MEGNSEDVTGWKIVSLYSGWRIVSKYTGYYSPLYHGMHRLICKLAWRYSRRCALSVEDLVSEGYIALLQAEGKYDSSRASRSTFVYWVVRNHFCQLTQRWPIMLDVPEHLTHDPLPILENAYEFRSAIASLSDEAKQVIQIILAAPKELLDIAQDGSPVRLQNAIVKLIRRNKIKEWTKEHIKTLICEIKLGLNNYNK